MTVIADSGALYALYDADDVYHEAVRQVLEAEPGPIIVQRRYWPKWITCFASF